MIPVLSFWFTVQLLALAVWPLTWRWLGALPSRGYALAKPLGLLLVCYTLWLLGSLGFLRNSAGGLLFSWVLVAGIALWLGRAGWRRDAAGRRPLLDWLAANWRLVAAVEGLFFVALAGWAFVRSYSPEITTAGGEKFMELMFLNGILRSPQFPPLDPWLSGFAISYYYFGYVMLAALTRLSGLAPAVAFNVGLAAWFALTITAAFGVAFDMAAALLKAPLSGAGSRTIRRPMLISGFGGLLGALFVGVLSNLEGFLESMQGLGLGSLAFWRWLDIKDLNCLGGANFTEPLANCPAAGGLLPDRFFWWWRASRVINDRDLLGNAVEVIDEFPFFSFLLGDMHPHVLALPFVLLAIGLALALMVESSRIRNSECRMQNSESGVVEPARIGWLDVFPLGASGFVLSALCLGALAFLNTWDFPIYVGLVTLVLGARLAWERGGLSLWVVGRALLTGLALGVLGALLYLPFYLGFQSQAAGILPNFLFPTRLSQFFVMFGPLLAAAVFLLLALSRDARRVLRRFLGILPFTVLTPLLFLLLVLALGLLTPGGQELVARLSDLPMVQQSGLASLGQLAAEVVKIRLGSPWTYLLLATLLAWILALLAQRNAQCTAPSAEPAEPAEAQPATELERGPAVVFALLALSTAFLLAFGVEFVYLRDTFGTRMNTVFKFYYQAWVLLALVAAFAVVYLIVLPQRAGRVLRLVGLPTIALLVVAGLFYPLSAAYTRAERFAAEPTLDGTAYLARQYPGDAAAIDWLRANVPGNAVILEASGGSYSYFGRISAQTGLATLLGWDGHELQWRGNTAEQDQRRPDIERIYAGNASPEELQRLLAKWQIDYVIVGDPERQAFGLAPQSEARLAQVLDLVYDAQGVRIYRRRG